MGKGLYFGVMEMFWNQREPVGLYNIVNVNTPELFPLKYMMCLLPQHKTTSSSMLLLCKHPPLSSRYHLPEPLWPVQPLPHDVSTSSSSHFCPCHSAQPLWPPCSFPACELCFCPRASAPAVLSAWNALPTGSREAPSLPAPSHLC